VEALEYVEIRDYRLALDKVEGLVVQCLFEMEKLKISGTGYKLRTHIAKVMNTRLNAIWNAIDKYNEIAARMIPPCTHIAYDAVVDYCLVVHFDLL